MWANIQDSGHPWDISWHLGEGAAWRPFFGPLLPLRELATIQVCVCVQCVCTCVGISGLVKLLPQPAAPRCC